MTVVNILDELIKWSNEHICSKVKLKAPPEDDDFSNSAGYEYKLVTPACFPFFIPTKDKLPPKVKVSMPSLCISITDGVDDLTNNTGSLTIQFAFATWHTGLHGKDYLIPKEDGSLKQWNDEESRLFFERNIEGWRDVWNWIDVALRAIESTDTINGIEIDRASGIKFYPFKEQGAILDFYPYWFGALEFKVNRSIVRNTKKYNEFL